jgi:3-phosphoshikimate 1-carboxyvinyltransferase
MVNPAVGTIELPGDKSISHRSAMFSVLAQGSSHVTNVSTGGDVASTIRCLQQLGADIELTGTTLTANGHGLTSLQGENIDLDCGNSGTSLRLFTGLLSGQPIHNVRLVGDSSLSRRPHNRVIAPLRSLGVDIVGRDDNFTPIALEQSVPTGGSITMDVASGQVKSAILLSGLYASQPTSVTEVHPTRDHTENMLRSMGVTITRVEHDGTHTITIEPQTTPLHPLNENVPGDPSSAAFFAVLAAITPGSSITMRSILLNPLRTAWIQALRDMGADITIEEKESVFGEPVGDVTVSHAQLHSIDLRGDIISSLIDELPILSLAMASASGTSTVKDASELRVKESDRISVVVDHLTRAGINVVEHDDGYEITGGELHECKIVPHGDHRIVMTFTLLNYVATGTIGTAHGDEVATSFPQFFDILHELTNV